jgi:hypothetical protein
MSREGSFEVKVTVGLGVQRVADQTGVEAFRIIVLPYNLSGIPLVDCEFVHMYVAGFKYFLMVAVCCLVGSSETD